MSVPDDDRTARVARFAEAEREARRDTRREMLRVMAIIAFWTACGLFLIAMAFHVDDGTIGKAFWWGGHIVWIAGVASAVHAAYRRGEERGDW